MYTLVSVNLTTTDSEILGKLAVERCFSSFQALQRYDVKKVPLVSLLLWQVINSNVLKQICMPGKIGNYYFS